MTAASRIREGQRLAGSYHHAVTIYDGQVPCALTEPKVFEVLKDQIRRVNELFSAWQKLDEFSAKSINCSGNHLGKRVFSAKRAVRKDRAHEFCEVYGNSWLAAAKPPGFSASRPDSRQIREVTITEDFLWE